MPAQRLRAELDRDGRLDNIRFSLRQDKVLDFLVDKAEITEVDQLTKPADADPDAPPLGESIAEHGEPGHVHGPDCDHDH
jgi:trigger factor